MVQAVSSSHPASFLDATTNENPVTSTTADGILTSSLPMRKRKQEVLLSSSSSNTAGGGVPTPTGPADKILKMENTQTAAAQVMSVTPNASAVATYSTDILRLAKEHAASAVAAAPSAESDLKPIHRAPMPKAREIRLEQNRKAARESRRRKKIMIEELQRSVVFFSRANGTLKQQNDELERLLIAAQSKVQAYERGAHPAAPATGNVTSPNLTSSNGVPVAAPGTTTMSVAPSNLSQGHNASSATTIAPVPSHTSDEFTNKEHRDVQAQEAVASAQAQAQQAAQAAATQAMFQNQGFPPAAARAAAQTFVSGPPSSALALNMNMHGSNNVTGNAAAAPNAASMVSAAPSTVPAPIPVPSPVATNTTSETPVPAAAAPAPFAVNPSNQVQMWPFLMSMGAAAAAATGAGTGSPVNTNNNEGAQNTNPPAPGQVQQTHAQQQQQHAAVQNAFLASMQQQLSQQMQQQGISMNNANAAAANNLFSSPYVNQVQTPMSVQGNATQTNTVTPAPVTFQSVSPDGTNPATPTF